MTSMYGGGVGGGLPAVAAAEEELQLLQHENDQHMEDPDEEMEVMNNEDAEESEYGEGIVEGDFFPLPELRKDIVRKIFKKLNAKDRLKARVNWDLYQMEAAEKYALHTLSIKDPTILCYDESDTFENVNRVEMLLTKDCQTYVDALKKLTENTSIDYVFFDICRREYAPLLSIVSRIPCSSLCICIENDEVPDSLLTEECVEELMAGRVQVTFRSPVPGLTPDLLRRLFERMGSAGDALNEVEFVVVDDPIAFEFLYSIGLIYHNGRFFPTNRDIEVYERYLKGEISHYEIISGNRLIWVEKPSLDWSSSDCRNICLERIDEDKKRRRTKGMNQVIYLDEE